VNTLDLAQQRVRLRKASTTNGGEWQGPCPGCEKNELSAKRQKGAICQSNR